jgi:hypothetical protein
MQTIIPKFLCLIVFAISSSLAFAQPGEGGGKRGEKLEALRIAFITEKLSLTPQEAQVFWPVYNEYQTKLKEIRAQGKMEMKNFDTATDAEMEKVVTAHFDAEQRTLNLQKEYYLQLKKVLPVRKIMKLFRAERDFKNRLLEQIGDRRDDAPPPPPMRPRRFRN